MTNDLQKNKRVRGLLALLPLTLAACSGMNSSGSPSGTTGADPADMQPLGGIPAAIAAPSGSKLVATLKGSGLQHYECKARGDAAGGYDWAFVAPEAVLRDRGDAIVGRHYAGPTWEYGDGSKVVGKLLASTPAPNPGNLPWLLLQGTAAATPGALAGVDRVQRIATSGGTAPSEPCTRATAGTKSSVRYTADYLFYRS